MISALAILKEVRNHPNAKPIEPVGATTMPTGDSFCVRHVKVRKNPLSRSYCDKCLDYFKARHQPRPGRGRIMIPRGGAA